MNLPSDRTPFQTSAPLFTPLGERASELGALVDAEGLSSLVLTQPESVYYATGYPSLPSSGNPILYALRNRLPAFAVVSATGQVSLACWGFSVEGVALSVDEIVTFNDMAGARLALADVAREASGNGKRLGIESTCPRFASDILQEHTDADRLIVADRPMREMRLIKSSEEVDRLEHSLAIVEETVAELYSELAVNASRLSLMQRAKLAILEKGASGLSHATFTFGTTNPEIALDETLSADQLVVLDLGAIVDGYCSDNRRYAYAGEIPKSLAEQHAAMVNIVDAVGASLMPGTSYAAIQNGALALAREHCVEFLPRFSHTGHHIGLETEEDWITEDECSFIRPGMVINIELYSLTPNGQQIGTEETYVITDVPRRISMLSRAIRSV